MIGFFNTRSWISPFLLGVAAMGCQIILMREFCIHFSGNELAYGVLLAFWLIAAGVGSLAADRIRRTPKNLSVWYHGLLILFAAGLVLLRLSRFLMGTLPGETAGLGVMLLFALTLSAGTGIPLGMLFVFNARRQGGNIPRVYLAESLGAALSGGLVYFMLLPAFSNWTAYALLAGAVALTVTIFMEDRPPPRWRLLPVVTVLFLFARFDLPLQRAYWAPFHLSASLDTSYSRLQVLQESGQISVYDNGRHAFTSPDPAGAEDTVHFNLLQNPTAARILLIGSSGGDVLREILKYPHTRVDLIEIDPEAGPFLLRHLSSDAQRLFHDPRVRRILADGRTWLKREAAAHDMILLNLTDPSTARLNRYFTREFYHLARDRLRDGGVLSFRSSCADTYISHDEADYLASLRQTLKSEFSHVEVVPGESCIFLASDRPLIMDPDALNLRSERLGLDLRHLIPSVLSDRLAPLRRERLDLSLSAGRPRLNRDLRPIGYLFSSLLWGARSSASASAILRRLAATPRVWFFEFPLVLFLFGLVSLLIITARGRWIGSLSLIPLFVMGITTMIVEILVIMAYQINHGALYREVALLFTAFMLGLSIGAHLGRRRRRAGMRDLIILQALLMGLALGLRLLLPIALPPACYHAFLFILGSVNGWLFIMANRIYLRNRPHLGAGYGLDLLGSFAGTLGTASLLIPLFGLLPVADALLGMNGLTLIFLAAGRRAAHN